MSLAQINENQDRMPYVKYERRAVEDPMATLAAGHYVAKDIDYALVTPPYSKDVMIHKVDNWFKQLAIDVQNQRLPNEWLESYKKSYSAWQNGQELPLEGVPIRGWGIISPAQQETLIKMHILTVEQLAAITSEGILRIGMGGQDLKLKAESWLKQLQKNGGAALELAKMRKENDQLKLSVKILSEKIELLLRQVPMEQGETISPSGLFEDDNT
jgi:hypothetical protein